MGRALIIILLSLPINIVSAQKTVQQISLQNERLVVIDNGIFFPVDTTMVIIRASNITQICNTYSVQAIDKNNYITIATPHNNHFSNFILALNNDPTVKQIIYCTSGYYQSTDPLFSSQWYLNVINISEAWLYTMGDSSIVVAVLDSGVNWLHDDLGVGSDSYHNIFQNYGEDSWLDPYTSRGNGIDDDNNGYIDDWKGWDFASLHNIAIPNFNGHGNCVAGIIAAKTNNNIGIAGIAGGNHTKGVKILPCAVGLNNPQSNAVVEAIYYAVDMGAHIIQMSLSIPHSPDIEAALEYANNHNVVSICCSGNSGNGPLNATDNIRVKYPASNPYVISVGAIDINSQWANFSYFGDSLDLVAPGDSIISTAKDNSEYKKVSGTSFAAPQVSATAALMLSVNPKMKNYVIASILKQTATKNDGYEFTEDANHPEGTWNHLLGYGTLNAGYAVRAAYELRHSDLMVRDSISDSGIEPSTVKYMWKSPDIWIEDMYGIRVGNPIGGGNYFVCVRVHNRGESASSGHERLYLNWTKAGVDLRWNESWLGQSYFECGTVKGGFIGPEEGVQIPVIASQDSRVVRVPWTAPLPSNYTGCTEFGSDAWHFCLLARVVDGDDFDDNEKTDVRMAPFTLDNNNVAWKNISILDESLYHAVISVTNPNEDEAQTMTLAVEAHDNSANENILQYAEVNIYPDSRLLTTIHGADADMTNCKLMNNERVTLLDNHARMDFDIEAGTSQTVRVTVNFYSNMTPVNDTMEFDVILYDEEGILVGGEHFIAIRGDAFFDVLAHDDISVAAGSRVSFRAEEVNYDAVYNWYDATGTLVDNGLEMETTATTSTRYMLEVTDTTSGCKGYDTVSLGVRLASITSLSPNPATSSVTVGYSLADGVTSATLNLTNQSGTLYRSVTLNQSTGTCILSLQAIPAGLYTVSLATAAGVHDIKTLIIQ